MASDSIWRAFLISLVLSVSFSPHGSPWYGFLSAWFSSLSHFLSPAQVAGPHGCSDDSLRARARQARKARSRGGSVPCARRAFATRAPSSFAAMAPYPFCGRCWVPFHNRGSVLGFCASISGPPGSILAAHAHRSRGGLETFRAPRSAEPQGEWPRTPAQAPG